MSSFGMFTDQEKPCPECGRPIHYYVHMVYQGWDHKDPEDKAACQILRSIVQGARV